MAAFYHDVVRILKPGKKTNRAGEETLDYTDLDEAEGVAWPAVHVRPTAQQEIVGDDRETALSMWRIASRPGSPVPDLESTDWVRLPDGTVCSVVGDVAKPTDPISGAIHHVEVTVERANR